MNKKVQKKDQKRTIVEFISQEKDGVWLVEILISNSYYNL
jgi:hypothetical protein